MQVHSCRQRFERRIRRLAWFGLLSILALVALRLHVPEEPTVRLSTALPADVAASTADVS
jgi:hypothetical protein